MPSDELSIGIDCGTSLVKSVLFDSRGNVLDSVSDKFDNLQSEGLWLEQDMAVIWSKTLGTLSHLLQRNSYARRSVKCIGITSHGDGVWMIDGAGNPVRNGIYWCDGRAKSAVDEFYRKGLAERAFDICGTAVFTGSQPMILQWLMKHEPESLERAAAILHCKDWVFFKMTGMISSDDTDESLPMLDMQSRDYSEALFDIFSITQLRDKFPDIRPCAENSCTMADSLADELGLNRGIVVASGPMDVSACALGAGAVRSGQAVSILGTAAIHEVVMDRPRLDPRLVGMTLCHATGNTWLRMLAAMNATPNVEWAIQTLCSRFISESQACGQSIYEVLDSRLRKIPPGSNGVIFHPYLYPGGERAPFVDPNVKGSFWGLSSLNSTEDMMKAVYEGVGFAMKDCYTTMTESPSEIYLTGGGANSRMWAQMLADINQSCINIPGAREPGALGAAINARVAYGEFKDAAEAADILCHTARTFEPSAGKAEAYEEVFQIYRMLTDANRKIYRYASGRVQIGSTVS